MINPDREAVRKRPGMYVGLTTDGTGLCNLIFSIVEFFLWVTKDFALTKIDVELEADNSCTITIFNFGLPTTISKFHDLTQAEVIMTKLAGHPDSYSFIWGFQGIGPAPVNFLSKRLELKIWSGGIEYHLHFGEGVKQAPMSSMKTAKDQSGTSVHFWPDQTVFFPHHFDSEKIEVRLREYMALTGNAEIKLKDKRKT